MKEVKLLFPKHAWFQHAIHFQWGEDTEAWQQYDTLELLKRYKGPPKRLLVDQGLLLMRHEINFGTPNSLPPSWSSFLKNNVMPMDLRFGGSFSVRTTEAWTSESFVWWEGLGPHIAQPTGARELARA